MRSFVSAVLQPAAGTVLVVVRLIPVEQAGKIVWVEDAPDTCPSGHTGLLPRWGPCAQCGWACRHWDCTVCGTRIVDYDHKCRGQQNAL